MICARGQNSPFLKGCLFFEIVIIIVIIIIIIIIIIIMLMKINYFVNFATL